MIFVGKSYLSPQISRFVGKGYLFPTNLIIRRLKTDWRYFCATFFLKTVSFGNEINFFVHVGFFDFSIRIQRYKERKILGGILKVMINYSVKGQWSDWRYFCANIFLKTVSFGNEIIFFSMSDSLNFWYESNGIKNVTFRIVFWKLWSIIQSKVRIEAIRDILCKAFSLKLYLLATK